MVCPPLSEKQNQHGNVDDYHQQENRDFDLRAVALTGEPNESFSEQEDKSRNAEKRQRYQC